MVCCYYYYFSVLVGAGKFSSPEGQGVVRSEKKKLCGNHAAIFKNQRKDRKGMGCEEIYMTGIRYSFRPKKKSKRQVYFAQEVLENLNHLSYSSSTISSG